MKLNLNKPIVFFDLETTGTDVAKDQTGLLRVNDGIYMYMYVCVYIYKDMV